MYFTSPEKYILIYIFMKSLHGEKIQNALIYTTTSSFPNPQIRLQTPKNSSQTE